MIRPAKAEDIPAIVKLGERFHAEAGWADVFAFVPEDCAATLHQILQAPAAGILLVADDGGSIAGMAGAFGIPHYLNRSHLQGMELFWWAEPTLRDGTGGALLDELEAAARRLGCHSFIMGAVAGLRSDVLARFYRRRGYRPCEHTFIKRLDV